MKEREKQTDLEEDVTKHKVKSQASDAEAKTNRMGTASIAKLLAEFSIPAVIAMIVNSIYNIVDRIFIGQYVGEDALAALTIVFPVMMIIFAFAGLVGIGSAALISINLGKKDFDMVNRIFGNMLSLGIIVVGIISGIIYINLDSILSIFGATPEILHYASSYLLIILLGFTFQMVSFSLNGVVRTEGKPRLAMGTMLIAAITNIILDYIFIVNFGWGVEGAAIATITGQLMGLLFLLRYFITGQSAVRFHFKNLMPDFKVAIAIFSIGISSFVTTLGTSVAMTFLNRALGTYGGVAAITSMGAINSIYTLFIMPMIGLQQGLQPIIGYNHGAGSNDRVKGALKLGLSISISFSVVIFLLLQSFPIQIISLFLDPSSDTIDVAVKGLRIFILMLPLVSINIIGTGFFQSVAKSLNAIVLGALRQFICLLPLVIFLPMSLGLTGVWLATPIADGIAIVATSLALLYHFKSEEAKLTPITQEG